MRRFFAVPFAALCLLQLASVAATPAQTSQKKTVSATTRKRVVRRKPAPPVDPTIGDVIDGDDLTVRRAAVAALGGFAGSVVVVDPANGKVLTIVNQKLALKSGFIPCSTIKLVTSLAALTENIVGKNTNVPTSRYVAYNLTQALAHSNNQYFNILGRRLGFDRVHEYAEMLGLGEKAGLDISGEEPGVLPEKELKEMGGVGLMTSFGTGITMTPLELAALLSAISNGGKLYYLQYPRTPQEADTFEPKLKRELKIVSSGWEDIKDGMKGAVDYGTARLAGYDQNEPILGKTGTCTDAQSARHMGWFGSFNEAGAHRLVVVVMLTGGSNVSGPIAAGVGGKIYRNLSAERYFTADADSKRKSDLPEIISTQVCCAAGH